MGSGVALDEVRREVLEDSVVASLRTLHVGRIIRECVVGELAEGSRQTRGSFGVSVAHVVQDDRDSGTERADVAYYLTGNFFGFHFGHVSSFTSALALLH